MYKWSANVMSENKSSKIVEKDGDIPDLGKLVIAGFGGMFTGFILQPIDFVKIRMQVNGEGGTKRDHINSFHAVKNIFQKEGLFAFYNGTSANLFRQGIYSSARFGFYKTIMDLLHENEYSGIFPYGLMFAGLLGSFAMTPADVAVVRMMADGRLPESERRNYKNVFNSLYRIGKEEGMIGLWAGTIPSLIRATISNLTTIYSYLEIKGFFIKKGYMEDNTYCHFICSFFSGLVCTTAATPFDMCKTRIQTMKTENGVPTYSGFIDVWKRAIETEGISALWKGYVPLSIRTTKATILLFLITEELNILYRKHIMKLSNPKRLIQTMKTENGVPTYSGFIDVWKRAIETEGISALWKGYVPLSIRTTKATILLFLITEELNILYRKHIMKLSNPKRL